MNNSTQIFIQTINFKGVNSGLSINLSNIIFDYCPIDLELDYLEAFDRLGKIFYVSDTSNR